MRHLRLLVVALVVLLASASPALAQSSGAAGDQYADQSPGPCDPGASCTSVASPSVAGGIRDTADTAARGTEAVNEALSESGSPASSDSPEKVAGLTELPDTGGASPLAAGLGVLLAAYGLLVRRISG